jgi:hypothetical protein
MLRSAVFVAAALAIMAVETTSPAIADAPCAQPPCGAPMRRAAIHRNYVVPRYYIVDRGPVYGGPGIFTNPTVVWHRKMPRYPYVGHVYPGY